MRYRMPDYYSKFECVADQCPLTCCKGWGIVIDDKTFEKYNNHIEKKEYICEHVDAEEQMFLQKGDRCSFLNCDNLCDLYINVGKDYLCNTCRRYPRHFEFYGDLIEGALSMSCPVAAEHILGKDNKNKFLVRNIPEKKRRDREVDLNLLDLLLMVRKSIIDRAKSEDDFFNVIKDILKYGDRLQEELYRYEKLGARSKIVFFNKEITKTINDIYLGFVNKSIVSFNGQNRDLGNRQKLLEEYIDMLLGLENINEEWPESMELLKSTLYILSKEEYNNICCEFKKYMQDEMYEYTNIFVYFIYTYFLGSVYDFNAQAMIKFSTFCVLIIREWQMATWLKLGKNISKEDRIKLCYLFSRQIEHSDNNLTSLEGIMTAHPKFSSDNIIQCL